MDVGKGFAISCFAVEDDELPTATDTDTLARFHGAIIQGMRPRPVRAPAMLC